MGQTLYGAGGVHKDRKEFIGKTSENSPYCPERSALIKFDFFYWLRPQNAPPHLEVYTLQLIDRVDIQR
jgi:hypothetical protein